MQVEVEVSLLLRDLCLASLNIEILLQEFYEKTSKLECTV